jgi:hypothetical protein
MSIIYRPLEAKRLAEQALLASPHRSLHRLRVTERDDSIVLSGTLSSFYLKQIAQGTVRCVIGEMDLINSIAVV